MSVEQKSLRYLTELPQNVDFVTLDASFTSIHLESLFSIRMIVFKLIIISSCSSDLQI